jgi:hypothetical protein
MNCDWKGLSDYQNTECYGWKNCAHLQNGLIELMVTTDVGPRVIRLGFIGQDNEFATWPEMLGKTGGDEWRIYGGHRLWHAPEDPVRTYWPDNVPVQVEAHDGFVRFIQPLEETTGIVKEMDIALHPDKALVRITHRLINRNLWAVSFAPWALSVMAPGGVGVIPLPPRGSHPKDLLSSSSLTLWPYTDMSDVRWTWGEKFILLRQEPGNAKPQKIGAFVPDGWVAYARRGHLFVKQFDVDAGAAYPDRNSTVELFTNGDMLEVETLGPLTSLAPGSSVTHTEVWSLTDDVPQPESEQDVQEHVTPKVMAVLDACR